MRSKPKKRDLLSHVVSVGPVAITRHSYGIRQGELQEYIELCELKKQHEALRQSLLNRCENGASVEPGALDVRFEVGERVIASAAKLKALLGEEAATDILAQIEPTPTRYLSVRPRQNDYVV